MALTASATSVRVSFSRSPAMPGPLSFRCRSLTDLVRHSAGSCPPPKRPARWIARGSGIPDPLDGAATRRTDDPDFPKWFRARRFRMIAP